MCAKKTLEKIGESKIVSVIRANNSDECLRIVEAVGSAGIKVIEITMTTPFAIRIIEDIVKKFGQTDIIIGAGTVNDASITASCIASGAEFIVSPIFDSQTGKVCNGNNILYIPGAFTPNEIFNCMKESFHFVKIFPASWTSPNKIKELKGPFPSLEFLPTGGINLDNIEEWFDAGATAVAVGSEITKFAKEKDFKKITETAKAFLETINRG